MALVVEIAISSIFSIRYLQELLQSSMAKTAKAILILVIAFGLCYNIPELGIFYKAKFLAKNPKVLKHVNIVFSALVLARMTNVFESWFAYLKKRHSEIG